MSIEKHEKEERSPTELKNEFFADVLAEASVEAIIDELYEQGFEHEELDAFKQALQSEEFSESDIRAALAVPADLRERQFANFKEKYDAGEHTMDSIARALVDFARSEGYVMAFTAVETIPEPQEGHEWQLQQSHAGRQERRDQMTCYTSIDAFLKANSDLRGKQVVITRAKVAGDGAYAQDASQPGVYYAPKLPIVAHAHADKVLEVADERYEAHLEQQEER